MSDDLEKMSGEELVRLFNITAKGEYRDELLRRLNDYERLKNITYACPICDRDMKEAER